jgi:hypothetical protein
MPKLIKLVLSPFAPAVEVVGDLTIKVHVPYSANSVTVQTSPNYVEYKENADNEAAQIRQLAITTPTEQTFTLAFDLDANRKHTVKTENSEYTIELMAIGKDPIQGQQFPFFEFMVIEG